MLKLQVTGLFVALPTSI